MGLLGNAAEILPELVRRGVRPDMVTDQTSAHDLVYGYLPAGWSVEQWRAAQADPAHHAELVAAAKRSIKAHVEAMLAFHAQGIPTFDYGNNIRQVAHDEGVANAFDFPGFVPAYIRPLFCEGKGPFRWVALSGRSRGHLQDRSQGQGAVPGRRASASLARHGAVAHRVPGTARAHLLAGAWASAIAPDLRSTRWWRRGELKAPIVIGRDHLDTGSVASPNPRNRSDGATDPMRYRTGRCSTRC